MFVPDEQFGRETGKKDEISKEITSAANDKDNEILLSVKDEDDTSKGATSVSAASDFVSADNDDNDDDNSESPPTF